MTAFVQHLIRRRLLVVLLGLGVLGYGYHRYRTLPVEAFPDVSPNLVQIFTVTQGLAPEEVEKYVTYPIEVAMNGLPKLRLIRSVSNFGLSVVNVYFEDDMDIYLARQLVGERLRIAREEIPEGFGHPQLGPISTSMGLVLFYYLVDRNRRYDLTELRTLQDWIVAPMLRTVPGVTEVLGIGGWEKQYHVILRPEDLLRYDLTVQDVIARIHRNNSNAGAQFIVQNREEFIVRIVGLAEGISDLKKVVVKTVEGTPITLDQVADIRIGGAIRRGVQTRNGTSEVVAGMVIKLYGTNSAEVIGRVEKKLEEVRRALPEGVEIVPYYQQKSIIQASVYTVNSALFQGIVLVVLVLAVFTGALRPSLVAALAIPFSILFAAIGLAVAGISANLMTLGGLAIAIGMLVDGAIVVTDSVERRLRGGGSSDRAEAVAQGTAEVARPIGFAIAIVVLVFLPIVTLEGVEGKTFRPLAYAVILAMAGSLVYSLLFAPVAAHLLMRGPRPPAPGGPIQGTRWARARRASWAFLGNWSNWMEAGLARIARPGIRLFVGMRPLAVAVAVVLLGAGAWAFTRLGSEFAPTLQEGTIVVRLTMAPSIALEESTRMTQLVERRILRVPEVSEVVTRIGRGEVGAHTDPVNSAEMYVILKPKSKWRGHWTQLEVERLIRKEIGDVPGVLVNFTQPIQMTLDELMEGVRADLAIKIFGDDLDVLRERAEKVAAVVRGIRGAQDVQVAQVSGQPQLLVRLDRAALARWGLDVEDVERTVSAAVGGAVAGQVFEGVRRFDILVRYPLRARRTVEDIGRVLVPAPGGRRLPLSQLAEIRTLVGPRQITREDTQRFITVQCNVRGRDIGSFVAEASRKIREQVELPSGYYVTWGGQFRLQQEASRRLAVVVPATLALVLLMLYLAFNRLRDVLLIAVNIPLALVGGVLALLVAGENLSVPSSVGFIALFGIALENGLVLVTVMRSLAAQGLSPGEAAVRGAILRLRPVLMTATTTALGLLPLLVATGTGSEVQRPLAAVVVGGLVSATLLTILVLPALFAWFGVPKASRSG